MKNSAPRFYGPYEVVEKVGSVAYKLLLPEHARIHPVFHVSQLKKQVGAPIPSQPLPVCLKEDFELELLPEAVMECRKDQLGNLSQVLIKWVGLPHFENTWESVQVITSLYPSFSLEVKGAVDGGGNVAEPILKVYQRRAKPGSRGAQQLAIPEVVPEEG